MTKQIRPGTWGGVPAAVLALAAMLAFGCSDDTAPPDADVMLPDGGTTPDGPDVDQDTGPGLDAPSCSGSSCNRPPPPSCVDQTTRQYYDPIGACVDGRCEYTAHTETCSTRCVAGICLSATDVLHVDSRNAGSEDGSAQHPYRTIAGAVAVASDGAAIFIAAGTYAESLTFDASIELVGGFTGGSASDYAGGTGGDFEDVDPQGNVTVIDAASGDTLTFNYAPQALVYGLTITGGGHGIRCEGGQLTVASCNLRDNDAGEEHGGAIFAISECDLRLRDSTIENNKGHRGGGVASYEGKVEVRRCVVRNNEGRDDHGGGLYLAGVVELHDNWVEGNKVGQSLGYGWGGGAVVFGEGTVGHLSGNVFTANNAPSSGGGLFIDDGAEATVQNALFTKNACGELGGAGIYVDGLDSSVRSNATLSNITIADHACSDGPGGAILVEASNVVLENSILWNNGGGEIEIADGGNLTVRYSDVQGAQQGQGNISQDPRFVGGSGADAYALRSTAGHWDGAAWVMDGESSPCIDVGDPQSPVGDEPDPNGARINMGAFGGTAKASKTP